MPKNEATVDNKTILRRTIRGIGATLGIYVAVYLATWSAGVIDFAFVATNHQPAFARVEAYSGMGSIWYKGWGYSVDAERDTFLSKEKNQEFQIYGARLRYDWKLLFPRLGPARGDLEFHVPTMPRQPQVLNGSEWHL